MIRAWKTVLPGIYRLSADRTSETYYRKEAIKALGGRWRDNAWHLPEAALSMIGAQKMYLVTVAAHCHESEGKVCASQADVKRGLVMLGCAMCDRSERCGEDVQILKVEGEA